MELDSLKDVWKELGEKELRPDSDTQILSMLQKRSQSPIAKMKRNLYWELVAMVVCYSLAIWYYFTAWQGRYWEVALLLFIVGLYALFYYMRKNKLLKDMQCVACEVKSNLKRQLATLEKYVQFYFVSSVVLTPIAFFVAGLIVFFRSPDNAGTPSSFGGQVITALPGVPGTQVINYRFFITFILIGVLVTISVYFLSRWAINRLYGQHIKKLKALVQQMEEND
jgi:4-hydroxybenzoate polyprenyltransferase